MEIEQLIIYPVKSLRGISLNSTQVEKRGLQYDRRWMLTDLDGQFISQRSHPILSLIEVAISEGNLLFTFLDKPAKTLTIPALPLQKDTLINTRVFDNTCKAIPMSQKADKWFSNILGCACRLVYMPEESKRLVNPMYATPADIVSFADGYPFLLISKASLADLNEKLEIPVLMNRFRPNIVVRGEAAFGEDNWKEFKVNNLHFKGIKPCARCTMTTIDQATGKSAGPEPLKTLATYRRKNNKVLFGLNLIWEHQKWESDELPILKPGDQINLICLSPLLKHKHQK